MVLGQPVVEGGREEEGLGLVVVAEALVRPGRDLLAEPRPAAPSTSKSLSPTRSSVMGKFSQTPQENRESRPAPTPRKGRSALGRQWRVLTHAPSQFNPLRPAHRWIGLNTCRAGPARGAVNAAELAPPRQRWDGATRTDRAQRAMQPLSLLPATCRSTTALRAVWARLRLA